ncbi:nucleotidyltransferase domain-containing protein [Halalkalibacter urbisdiaboli]|uniref:nucleotidyltransferase domain-containing protein n=1 Tax=Halalkalibacter urbisdiaboli TaxID=1960589 RepID=UPI0013FD9332|nr:nucleotidyltransferase domain-containing protein [Halalkalibacter urbisdiaboli]
MGKIPNDIEIFVHAFTDELTYKFNDVIQGVYLYGSIALGAFNENKSDIDFIVLLKRELTNEELQNLKTCHSYLRKQKWGKRLDGMYLYYKDIGKLNHHITPYPYCSNGKIKLGHWDVNNITWWLLKNHGIQIMGPSISSLNVKVEWNNLFETMSYNINQYWYQKSKKPYLFLFSDMVEFAVTTLCRIIYSLNNEAIISKDAAVKYVLYTFPDKWELLLRETIRIREFTNKHSLYSSKLKRANDCKEFIKYAHKYCNQNHSLISALQ